MPVFPSAPACTIPDAVIVAFRFQINSTSDPDNIVSGPGVVTDITNSSGVYTCTLDRKYGYEDLVFCIADMGADLGNKAQFTSWTQSTRALVITTYANDGSPAAAEATDDDWVHVLAIFCKRSALMTSVAI